MCECGKALYFRCFKFFGFSWIFSKIFNGACYWENIPDEKSIVSMATIIKEVIYRTRPLSENPIFRLRKF